MTVIETRAFEDRLRSSEVSQDVVELARTVASRVAVYAQSFLNVDTAAAALESDMVNEIEPIFASLTLSDNSSAPSLTT